MNYLKIEMSIKNTRGLKKDLAVWDLKISQIG